MKAWHYAALPLFWLLQRFLAWMPEWMRERMGGLFGWLIRVSLKQRWRITDSNLRICFPELSTEEREAWIFKFLGSAGNPRFKEISALLK